MINQVSKSPLRFDQATVGLTVGTDDHVRLTADLNRTLGSDAGLRINVMKTDSGSTRDSVGSQREGIATLEWRLSPVDDLTLSYYYLKTGNTLDYGVPYFDNRPLDVPKNRFYGTDDDFENNTTRMTTARYRHRFGAQTELTTVLRAASYDRALWGVAPRLNAASLAATGGVLTEATVVNRQRQARGGEESTLTSQTDLTTRFQIGRTKHESLFGLELLREGAGRWNYNAIASAIAPATTVGNPDPGDALPDGYGNRIQNGRADYDGRTVGVYAQDMITFAPGWKLLGGLRHDRLNAEYSNGAVVDYSENSGASACCGSPTTIRPGT